MNKDEVLKLSQLARIELREGEAEEFSKEFEAILGYVGEINELPKSTSEKIIYQKNVFREDAHPHESGLYTEALLNESPHRDGPYFKVKKILG
jgi:aspartyl/glutamyl-tRNA(Asn/Gln) amidotransferase C subunit